MKNELNLEEIIPADYSQILHRVQLGQSGHFSNTLEFSENCLPSLKNCANEFEVHYLAHCSTQAEHIMQLAPVWT